MLWARIPRLPLATTKVCGLCRARYFVNAKNLDTNRVWKYGWRVQITSEVKDNVDFIKISGRMVHDGSLIRLREHVLYELQSGIPHVNTPGERRIGIRQPLRTSATSLGMDKNPRSSPDFRYSG